MIWRLRKSNSKFKYYRILWYCTTLENTYNPCSPRATWLQSPAWYYVTTENPGKKPQVRDLGQHGAKATETEFWDSEPNTHTAAVSCVRFNISSCISIEITLRWLWFGVFVECRHSSLKKLEPSNKSNGGATVLHSYKWRLFNSFSNTEMTVSFKCKSRRTKSRTQTSTCWPIFNTMLLKTAKRLYAKSQMSLETLF